MSYYDEIAKGYDELYKKEQLKKLKIIRKFICVDEETLMLDLGCGPCYSAELFECQILGLDPSIELLKIGKKRCKRKRVQFFKGIAECLPFKAKSFQITICVTAVHNFKNIQKGLSEVKRVTKDTVVLTLLKRAQKFEAIKTLIENFFSVKKELDEEKDLIFII